jgi:hypothetical protein
LSPKRLDGQVKLGSSLSQVLNFGKQFVPARSLYRVIHCSPPFFSLYPISAASAASSVKVLFTVRVLNALARFQTVVGKSGRAIFGGLISEMFSPVIVITA